MTHDDLPTDTSHWGVKGCLMMWTLAVFAVPLILVVIVGAGLDQVKDRRSRSCRARTQARSPVSLHSGGGRG